MSRNAVLLSIHPTYADQIFAGTKRVELRRTRPPLVTGDLIVVYVTTPIKAIVGLVDVEGVMADRPHRLWTEVEHTAGITRDQFDRYYDGASTAFGILLRRARNLARPLTLDDVQQQWRKFWPPQTYRSLSPEEMALIHTVAQ